MSGIIGTATSKSGIIGAAKDVIQAYAQWNHSSFGVNRSYGVSSITNSATGRAVVNFLRPQASAQFTVGGSCGDGNGNLGCLSPGSRATTSISTTTTYSNGSEKNFPDNNIIII